MGQKINRLPRAIPAHLMDTYMIVQPKATHTRVATCAEIECDRYARGWRTIVDVATELGARQANHIRLHSGRSFTVAQSDTVVIFEFPPGQTCFAEHRVSLQRPEIFVKRGGDWRGNPTGTHQAFGEGATGGARWVDSLATQLDRIADTVERG